MVPLTAILAAAALGHETGNDGGLFPINPKLGVSGFPDCIR